MSRGPSSAKQKTMLQLALTRRNQCPAQGLLVKGLGAKRTAEVGGLLGGVDQVCRLADAREILCG